jgi:hypothetical protein
VASKSLAELRNGAIVKALSKRSKIDLCTHGINKKYCTFCEAQKSKSRKKAKTEESAPQE